MSLREVEGLAGPAGLPARGIAGSARDLGAQAFANELTRLDIKHSHELFDGTHSDIAHRYPAAIRELVRALEER
jgi:hypothetical protein